MTAGSEPKTNGCTGACCEDFTLNVKGLERFPVGYLRPLEGDHYTCSKWDRTTRRCTVYDQRPQICRDYPEVIPCPNPGCDEALTHDPSSPNPLLPRP